jgi:NAD(P) transhydrogenase
VVVGAGVIGIEYTSMFAALGSSVTLVEKNPTMLEFCDAEIVEALRYPSATSASPSASARR